MYLCASKKNIIMANIEFNNKTYEMDGDGFMVHPEEWNKELAAEIAKADGIAEMTENHWKVVDCIRANYEEKGIAPMVRTICKTANLKLKDIYELFPLGPARGACRVAGLPKPEGCV
jgi:tRNA 2-thiouridine synthesizing protein E